MRFIYQLPKLFFYHHVFMAVCAAALCLQTLVLLNHTTIDYLLAGFLFAATLLSYNLHFFLASLKSGATAQLLWFRNTYTFTLLVNAFSLIAIVFLLFYLKEIHPYVLIAVLLNGVYTAPLLFKKSLRLPLIFTLIKSYFVGFTWAFATVVLPVVLLQKQPGSSELAVFIHRFMLVSLATLLFDYRDKERDLQFRVFTPANVLNEKQYNLFFAFNFVLFAASALWLIMAAPSYWQWLQLLPCIYMWWLYRQSKKRTDDLFYLSFVDGSLFLSAVLSIFLLI
jgi:hypothetical protein